MESPTIESIVIRLVTDKPVQKTPYQVKGVFMRRFPQEKIVPFLDGKLRDTYLYPRVQVKILNEQIYIIGIKEGVSPVLALVDNIKSINFGNITINIEKFDIEENKNQLNVTENLLRYNFITPWVALNKSTGGKYRFLTDQEKPLFLNKLLGQNILFIAKEVGLDIETKIFTKVSINNLSPDKIDENGWGAFSGEFRTNFILPSYIGLGNGITRGFGTIFSLNNPDSLKTEASKDKIEDYEEEEINEKDEAITFVTIEDVPVINKRKNHKKRYSNHKKKKKGKYHRLNKNRDDVKNNRDNAKETDDDSRFNSAEYHQKQHDF
tara:strand:+ start:1311 stop:2276 length:966 start_codon:yes stop_codon:yes gene_type:complete